MLDTCLYTSRCTKPVASPTPSTLADWQQAYLGGESPAKRLGALRERLAGRGDDPAVIRLIEPAELAQRLAAWAALGLQAGRGAWYLVGIGVAAGLAAWHFTLIRTRTREGCFQAFRVNHWVGFAVFAGTALDLALR